MTGRVRPRRVFIRCRDQAPSSRGPAASRTIEHLTFNVGSTRHDHSGPGELASPAPPPLAGRFGWVGRRRSRAGERYDWDYLWMLAFTAILFFRPQDHVAAAESLHLAELCAIAGLASMAVRRLRAGQTIARINAEVGGVIVLGLVILLTIPFSFWPGGSLALFTDIYIKIILIFALMMSTISTPRRLHQMTWLMILASGYIAGRGVLDYLSGANLVEGDRLRGAVGGMFKNPNDLALNLVTFLAPTLFIVFLDRRTLRRLVAALAAALMVAATVFTKSRSGFLGLVAMTAVVVYYTARIKPSVIFALVLAGLLAMPAMPASFWTRMDSIVNPTEDPTGSREARIRLLNQAVDVFADNPLTGIGAGQFQNYNGPGIVEKWRVTHNVWLQVGAELGIFGLATFGFLVARAYSACLQTLRVLRRGRSKFRALDLASTPQSHSNPVTGWRSGRSGSRASRASEDEHILEMNAKGMLAGLVGWTTCAFFASVAFNWTFYFVLALAAAGREIATSRAPASVPEPSTPCAPPLARVPA